MSSETFEVSTDVDRLDLDLIHRILSESYWAAGRGRDVVVRSIANSLCFGVYHGGEQVAFARLITDRAVFGYLADVFVLPAYRGRGVARLLIQAVLDHGDARDLSVILLRTRDAQGLYTKFGFSFPDRPGELMSLYPREVRVAADHARQSAPAHSSHVQEKDRRGKEETGDSS